MAGGGGRGPRGGRRVTQLVGWRRRVWAVISKAGVDKCFQMGYKCIKQINTLGISDSGKELM